MDLVSFESEDEWNLVKSFMDGAGIKEIWTSGRLCDAEVIFISLQTCVACIQIFVQILVFFSLQLCVQILVFFYLSKYVYKYLWNPGERVRCRPLQAAEHQRMVLGFHTCQGAKEGNYNHDGHGNNDHGADHDIDDDHGLDDDDDVSDASHQPSNWSQP